MYTVYKTKPYLIPYIYSNAPNARKTEWITLTPEHNTKLAHARIRLKLTELYRDNWEFDGVQYLHKHSIGMDYQLAILYVEGTQLIDVR